MSRLKELMERLCPDGVEYKKLGEVGRFLRGSSFQKKHFVDFGTPCIHYGQVHTRFGLSTDCVVSYLEEGFSSRMKRAQPGDLIIATTSEDDDAVGKATAWLGDHEVVVSNDAFIYRHDLDPMYMSYFFACEQFQVAKMPFITGSKVRRLSGEDMAKIRIPVPPIEVQREVVRVLDSFQELDDALTAEIEARERQYSEMRNKLILDNTMVPYRPFGECCESMNTGPFGSMVHKSDYVDDGCPIVNPADITGTRITIGKRVSAEAEVRLDRYRLRENDIVIGRRGEMGRIGLVTAKSAGYLCGTGCFFVRMNDVALPSYWSHFFGTSYAKQYLDAHAVGGTMKNLNLSILGGMPVPIPELQQQEFIVEKLGNAVSLIEAIRSERDARRRQFAYYRDKLLSFPERVG